MCLYPRIMTNKRYTVTEKNGGNVPLPPIIGKDQYGTPIYDERVLKVPIPCGNCIECRKQKANEWRIRLAEELKITNYPYFVTFTFAPKELQKLMEQKNIGETNAIAGLAVRRFLERFRKIYKKSLKHWLITELGHTETERIHLHGILLSHVPLKTEEIEKLWKYGFIWVGEYCNLQTINYIVKYVTKIDTDHKTFRSQIFCSPGIGKNYLEQPLIKFKHRYEKGQTKTTYRLPNGAETKLPNYYKYKLFNEEQRQDIWRDTMDKGDTYIMGAGHRLDELPGEVCERLKNRAQETNKKLGYGSDEQEWRKQDYNVTLHMIRKWAREEVRKKAYLAGKDAKNVKNDKNFE